MPYARNPHEAAQANPVHAACFPPHSCPPSRHVPPATGLHSLVTLRAAPARTSSSAQPPIPMLRQRQCYAPIGWHPTPPHRTAPQPRYPTPPHRTPLCPLLTLPAAPHATLTLRPTHVLPVRTRSTRWVGCNGSWHPPSLPPTRLTCVWRRWRSGWRRCRASWTARGGRRSSCAPRPRRTSGRPTRWVAAGVATITHYIVAELYASLCVVF